MRSRLRSFVKLAAFIAASIVVRASFADHYHVPSGSMEPTVRAGDHVFVNKAAYGIRVPGTTSYVMRTAEPARGDVVVLEGVEDPHGGPDFGPAHVPARHVLVLGDNRGSSHDGRAFGFVPTDRVLGRVVGVR